MDEPAPPSLRAALAKAKVQQKLFGEGALRPQLGRYELSEHIGEGAMGEVFLAVDVELRRDVALKVIRPRSDGEQADVVRRRLLREARAMAKLRHPNVIAVYEAGVIDDRAFIAMEFVDGTTLRQWSAKERSVDAILDAFAQAGEGLAAAHDAGLVHRDFKPENVLIDKGGRVQVTDFGVARALELPEEPVELTAGPVSKPAATDLARAGTPRYMAPEQFANQDVDARTDQFAFCVALYEALFGSLPFEGTTLEEIAGAARRGEIVDPPTSAPERVTAAIRRGLSCDPEERFASMRALLEAIGPEQQSPSMSPKWVVAALVVVVAGVVGAGAFVMGSLDDDSPAQQTTVVTQVVSATPDARAVDMAAAFAAAAIEEAGNAVLRQGVPKKPKRAPCGNETKLCRTFGRCMDRDGQCIAVAHAQCAASLVCKLDGACSAIGGKCVAGKDDDCAGSRTCERFDRCRASDGACKR